MNKKPKASAGVMIIGIILFIFFMIFFILPTVNLPHTIEVKQRAQFHSVGIALEFFNGELKKFPPSDSHDPNGVPYCGAMKLAEAMLGKDLMGFHPNSLFRSDGKDSLGMLLYDPSTRSVRKGPYMPIENANAFRIKEVFANTGPFDGNEYIICDTFIQKRHSGKKTGMPVLYYKADTTKSSHDVNNPDNPDNIYNYKGNYDLLALGVPDKPNVKHPLYEDPALFYIMTQNYRITTKSITVNKDTYILLSAGQDGLYGTSDDITNFDFKWRPKK